jgi:hypothetical protein
MSVRIGTDEWTFETVAGKQIVSEGGEGVGVLAHCHHDRHVITICGTLPVKRQLELAAKSALEIARPHPPHGSIPLIGPTETAGPNDTSP